MAKEVVYIEADDEITSVIDKVIDTKGEIVAVVLPKRAQVFQSVVNMRLLKKAAAESKKKIVLITSERSIESIAAVSSVYIAQTLNSKPEIPKRDSKLIDEATITTNELESGDIIDTPDDDTDKDSEDDAIEIDNTSGNIQENTEKTNTKKAKKIFKIPDFGSFRLRMTLGILAFIILISGWYLGFIVMPKATVTINTNTSSQAMSFDFEVQSTATALDKEKSILPAQKAEITKEDKVTVPATGEKNKGEKAKGTVTLTNCRTGTSGVTIPAGTNFTSGNLSFITTESIDLGPAVIIGTCKSADFPAFGAVGESAIEASNPGTEYNISARSLTSSVNGVSAFVSDMTGGSSNIVKVISNEDIQKAKDQLKGSATSDATDELKNKLSNQNQQALIETLEQSEPQVKTSAAVDAEAPEVTVTQTVTYKMLGISSSDLGSLIDFKLQELLKSQGVDKNIRNNGQSTGNYRLKNKTSFDNQTISFETVAVLGPLFDENALRKEIAGKRRGDIENMIESREGVRSVSVEYSPGWITTTPKSDKKIIIIINEIEN